MPTIHHLIHMDPLAILPNWLPKTVLQQQHYVHHHHHHRRRRSHRHRVRLHRHKVDARIVIVISGS